MHKMRAKTTHGGDQDCYNFIPTILCKFIG